jgi:hypothetical protein
MGASADQEQGCDRGQTADLLADTHHSHALLLIFFV